MSTITLVVMAISGHMLGYMYVILPYMNILTLVAVSTQITSHTSCIVHIHVHDEKA